MLVALDYLGTEGFIGRKIEQQLQHPDARLLVAVEGPLNVSTYSLIGMTNGSLAAQQQTLDGAAYS